MGSPEVSDFSVDYILRCKGAEEAPGRSGEGHRHPHGARSEHWYRAVEAVDAAAFPTFYTALLPPALGALAAPPQAPACCRPALSSFICCPLDLGVAYSEAQPWRFMEGNGLHPEYRYLPHAAEPRRRNRSRSRTVFTESQTQQLELLFGRTEYPTPDEREELARSTGLPHEVIRVWFKNRRARRKNQNLARSPNQNPAEEVRSGPANEHD